MSFYAHFSASGALPQLKELYLDDNQIRDVGMQALAGAVSKGALAQLTRLDLGFNRIGDAGLTALAEAIKPTADNASGALAPGAIVYLIYNSATETGKQAMRDAAKARGLRVYV